MDDREKLIELLTREIRAGAYFNRPRIEGFADYLIANSVVIQKQGEWIPVEDFDGEYHWQCTACKCEWWFEVGDPSENGSHYCPNCGAKMKEVK